MMSDSRLPDDVAHQYLDRLAVHVERNGVDREALARLQRAHVERVPYENLDVQLGRPVTRDPDAAFEKACASFAAAASGASRPAAGSRTS